jgi:hypothetical protein
LTVGNGPALITRWLGELKLTFDTWDLPDW